MAGVLLVAALCRLAISISAQQLGIGWTVFLCAPTAIVLPLLAIALRNRVGLLTLALCGAIVAMPRQSEIVWLPWNNWQSIVGAYLHTAIPPALSALVIGGPVAIADAWSRRTRAIPESPT